MFESRDLKGTLQVNYRAHVTAKSANYTNIVHNMFRDILPYAA